MKKTGIALGMIGRAFSVITCGAALVTLIIHGTGCGAGDLIILSAVTAALSTYVYKLAVKMEVKNNE